MPPRCMRGALKLGFKHAERPYSGALEAMPTSKSHAGVAEPCEGIRKEM